MQYISPCYSTMDTSGEKLRKFEKTHINYICYNVIYITYTADICMAVHTLISAYNPNELPKNCSY